MAMEKVTHQVTRIFQAFATTHDFKQIMLLLQASLCLTLLVIYPSTVVSCRNTKLVDIISANIPVSDFEVNEEVAQMFCYSESKHSFIGRFIFFAIGFLWITFIHASKRREIPCSKRQTSITRSLNCFLVIYMIVGLSMFFVFPQLNTLLYGLSSVWGVLLSPFIFVKTCFFLILGFPFSILFQLPRDHTIEVKVGTLDEFISPLKLGSYKGVNQHQVVGINCANACWRTFQWTTMLYLLLHYIACLVLINSETRENIRHQIDEAVCKSSQCSFQDFVEETICVTSEKGRLHKERKHRLLDRPADISSPIYSQMRCETYSNQRLIDMSAGAVYQKPVNITKPLNISPSGEKKLKNENFVQTVSKMFDDELLCKSRKGNRSKITEVANKANKSDKKDVVKPVSLGATQTRATLPEEKSTQTDEDDPVSKSRKHCRRFDGNRIEKGSQTPNRKRINKETQYMTVRTMEKGNQHISIKTIDKCCQYICISTMDEGSQCAAIKTFTKGCQCSVITDASLATSKVITSKEMATQTLLDSEVDKMVDQMLSSIEKEFEGKQSKVSKSSVFTNTLKIDISDKYVQTSDDMEGCKKILNDQSVQCNSDNDVEKSVMLDEAVQVNEDIINQQESIRRELEASESEKSCQESEKIIAVDRSSKCDCKTASIKKVCNASEICLVEKTTQTVNNEVLIEDYCPVVNGRVSLNSDSYILCSANEHGEIDVTCSSKLPRHMSIGTMTTVPIYDKCTQTTEKKELNFSTDFKSAQQQIDIVEKNELTELKEILNVHKKWRKKSVVSTSNKSTQINFLKVQETLNNLQSCSCQKENIGRTVHSLMTLTGDRLSTNEPIKFKAKKSSHGVWYVSLRGDVFLTVCEEVLNHRKLTDEFEDIERFVEDEMMRTMKVFLDNYKKLSTCFDVDENESEDESFINGFRL